MNGSSLSRWESHPCSSRMQCVPRGGTVNGSSPSVRGQSCQPGSSRNWTLTSHLSAGSCSPACVGSDPARHRAASCEDRTGKNKATILSACEYSRNEDSTGRGRKFPILLPWAANFPRLKLVSAPPTPIDSNRTVHLTDMNLSPTMFGLSGAVAQLGERCVRNAEVEGSIPFGSIRCGRNPADAGLRPYSWQAIRCCAPG